MVGGSDSNRNDHGRPPPFGVPTNSYRVNQNFIFKQLLKDYTERQNKIQFKSLCSFVASVSTRIKKRSQITQKDTDKHAFITPLPHLLNLRIIRKLKVLLFIQKYKSATPLQLNQGSIVWSKKSKNMYLKLRMTRSSDISNHLCSSVLSVSKHGRNSSIYLCNNCCEVIFDNSTFDSFFKCGTSVFKLTCRRIAFKPLMPCNSSRSRCSTSPTIISSF